MKILVTGANGYLGCGVVKQLLLDGMEVVATDFSGEFIDQNAEFFPADLFSLEDPYKWFGKPDALLHMAWRDGFVHNSKRHLEDLPNHLEFLDRMVKGGVRQIAVMGSMHEVGFYEGCISEYTPCYPQSYYGTAKTALRNAVNVLLQNSEFIFQWCRGYYIVGKTERGSSVFSKITQAEKMGKSTFPFTTGQNQFDFLDYDVFCRQISSTVEQTKVKGIIEICSGRPERLRDRVEKFLLESGYKIRLNYGEFPDRPYDSKAVWGSNSKINLILKRAEESL